MSKYLIHRTDGNAEALYGVLRAHGAQVEIIGQPLDALVQYRGVTAVVDVKTLTGKLRPKQLVFLNEWRGLTAILRTEADCLALLDEMRGRG